MKLRRQIGAGVAVLALLAAWVGRRDSRSGAGGANYRLVPHTTGGSACCPHRSTRSGGSRSPSPNMEEQALLHHPAGDGFVSLKASATDSHGNAVEQTIIRAYALKR